MRIERINGNSFRLMLVGGVSAPEAGAVRRARQGAFSAGEPAASLPRARSRSQRQRRPGPPPPEGRQEPAPEGAAAAMQAPARAALIAARVSIRSSMSFHQRERGRRICDRLLADSPCRYRLDRDTIRIWGELGAVCAAIRRCERAMLHGSLSGFEFNLLSQADTEDHGRPFSQPAQSAESTNREDRKACPELPPVNPEQQSRTDGFVEPEDSAAPG